MACDRRLIAMSLALMLMGCQEGAQIQVDQTPLAVSFTIKDTAGKKPLCADEVIVYPATPEDAAPIWRVVAAGYDGCVSRITYGAIPAGFADETPAVPLVPGQMYRVSASGTGFVGFQEFARMSEDRPRAGN